ncbi:MAG: phage holin family protein [Clostridiales bacterium]|nr:phage holin family protein [Clostridiales bacterium]
MKNFIISAAGVVGGVISSLYGGFTAAMTTLIIFMAVDWFSGMVCAGVFRSSRKSKSGGLSSKAGFRGLAKKCMIMLFVLIGARLDMALGIAYIKDGVCIAFTVNELLSIIENAGLMGVPTPSIIRRAIELLNEKIKRGSETSNDAENSAENGEKNKDDTDND